jgi:hypothetical protein
MDINTSRPALTQERLQSLEEPETVDCIVKTADDAVLYTLTFHSAFAVKIFEVIRREGRGVQGFERMQQSLRDSVEQVRTSLSNLPDACRSPIERFLEHSAESQSALMRLIRDLARYKNWMLGENPEPPQRQNS